MDKVKEFFQGSSKPAEEAQTVDKPSIQHQRVDSSVTPADITSSDETAQAPEAKPFDEPSGEVGQDLKDTGLTETQPELLEASKDQPSLDEAQNKASENAPSLDNLGEGQQKDDGLLDQERGDTSKLAEDAPAAQGFQAEPDSSKAPAVEPDQEHGDPTKLNEDDPAAQDSQAGIDEPNTSTIQPDQEHGDPSKLREDDLAAQDSPVVADEPKTDTVEPDQEHGDPSKLREDDPAAQDTQVEPDVSATQSGEAPTQQGGDIDTPQDGDALVDSKPDEPTSQELSEDKPQESFGEEKPLVDAGDEQPKTLDTEGGLSEGRQEDATNVDTAGTGLDETKDTSLHETQPDILETSQDGKPSIDDAQDKPEGSAADVGRSVDQPPAVGESEGVVDARDDVVQPGEAKDDSGPSTQGTEGGALGSSDGLGNDALPDNDQLPVQSQQETDVPAQDTSADLSTSATKPEDDIPPQTEQLPSTGGTEAQDAGLSQPEPGLSEPSELNPPAGDDARDNAQESAPDVPAEGQQPLTSELQDRPTGDELKEDQGQTQPGLSGVALGDNQLDTPGGDSKPADVPETQHESLLDAGGPSQSIVPEESTLTDQPKETPGAEGVPADREGEYGDEEGEDTGDPDKKPKLAERLKQKVKNIVHKDE